MSGTSELYASARIAAREREFLTEEDFSRLAHAGASECERLLAEWGRADERACRAELFAFFREAGTKPAFLACFEAKEDAFNAKCARKFAACKNPALRELASELGRVPAQRVFEAVESENYRGLSDFLAAALSALPPEAGAREIDRTLDAAYFSEREFLARELPDLLRRMFALETDLLNLGTLFRCRTLGEECLSHFMPGGTLAAEKLAGLAGLPPEESAEALKGCEARPYLLRALGSGEPPELALQELRLGLPAEFLAGRREGFFAQVNYWYRREAETMRLRRIRNAKRNGLRVGAREGV